MSDRTTAIIAIAKAFEARLELVTAIDFDDTAERILVYTNGTTEWLCEIGSDDDGYIFNTTATDMPVLTLAVSL